MAGINLIKQLRKLEKAQLKAGNTSAPQSTSSSSGGLAAQVDELRARLSESVAAFERADTINLILHTLGILLLVGSRFFLDDYFARRSADLQAQSQEIDAQITVEAKKVKDLKELIVESEQLDRQIGELERKLSVIEGVIKNRNAPVKMLDFVVTEMPDSVWLERIELDPKEAGEIKVSGYALTLQLVSDFISKLEGSVFFPSWNLIEGVEDSVTGGNGVGGVGNGVVTGMNAAPLTAGAAQNMAVKEGPAVEKRPPGTKRFNISAKVGVSQ